MQLESIQLSGFRSFAEPTTIDLDAGMTCIVGPDGCGKTSVLDSIRWALADSPDDQCFGGTEQRPPAAAASVTLNFLEGDLRNRFVRKFDEHGNHQLETTPQNISREEIAANVYTIESLDKLPSEPSKILLINRLDSDVPEEEMETVANRLEQLSSIHQLIVISHSKRIMHSSDKIIGVTMQEYGVSCLMSV